MKKVNIFLTAVVAVAMVFAVIAPCCALPDLDVAYIQRTPLYYQYRPTYIDNLDPREPAKDVATLSTDEQTKQRWPNPGENVTYTAVIKNPGNATVPSGTAYRWYYDGGQVGSGTLPSISAGGQTTVTYVRAWSSTELTTNHTIKFVADYSNSVTEDIETNNSREDRTNALSVRLVIHQAVWNWFRTNGRTYDARFATFDDWAQTQLIGAANTWFANSIWPAAPNGILERFRLDYVMVVPDSSPEDWYFDQQWGDTAWFFYNSAWPQSWIDEGNIAYPHGLVHELCHGVGLHDIYRVNLDINEHPNPIMPTLGHQASRQHDFMCNPWQFHLNETCRFSDWMAAAMNSKLHFRSGFFGDYMYDLPTTCRIRLVDGYNNPITSASLTFYRDEDQGFITTPDFTGTTDSSGYFTMPNLTCYYPTTLATGHTLHNSPWGMVSTHGKNAVFLVKIVKSGQTDYQWMELTPFNLAFQSGQTSTYTHTIQSTYLSSRPTTQDLYGVKMASSTSGHAVGANRTALYWNGTSWATKTTPTGTYDLSAVDTYSTYAYAVGTGGKVLRYASGSWSARTSPSADNLKAVAVLYSSNNVIVGGDWGALYRSIDGGSTWSFINLGITEQILSIKFRDANNGILVTNTRIFRSTNGGSSWTEVYSGGSDFADCCNISATEAYACNYWGAILKSTDGGSTWNIINTQEWYDSFWLAMDVKAGGTGWAGGRQLDGFGHASLTRLYNGRSAVYAPVITYGSRNEIYDISCVSANECWMVGKGGLIVRMVKPSGDTFLP